MFALSLAPPFFSIFSCIFLPFTRMSVSSSRFLVRDAALISYLINRPGQNVTCSSGRCPWIILDRVLWRRSCNLIVDGLRAHPDVRVVRCLCIGVLSLKDFATDLVHGCPSGTPSFEV